MKPNLNSRIKFSFLFCVLIAPSVLLSQVTLTIQNTPEVGKRYLYKEVSVNYLNLVNSTNGSTIDLQNLNFTGDSLVYIYNRNSAINPFSPYPHVAVNYNDTNILQKKNGVFRKSTQAYTQIVAHDSSGWGPRMGIATSYELLRFPFTKATKYTTSSLNCRPNYNWSGGSKMRIEGKGNNTLIIGSDTAQTLKVFHYDSCSASGGRNYIIRDIKEYGWYTQNSQLPWLKLVHTFQLGGSLPPIYYYDTTVYVLTQGHNLSSIIKSNKFNTSAIEIYPNPSKSTINIKLDSSEPINQILVLDIEGRLVKSFSPNSNKINVSDLTKGIYFLKVITRERTLTKKFFKQ